MLACLLDDSEWVDRQLKLIHHHHLERAANLVLENESWKALQSIHMEQRIQLEAKPFSAAELSNLIKENTREIRDWRRETAANRRATRLRQKQEIIDLDAERWA